MFGTPSVGPGSGVNKSARIDHRAPHTGCRWLAAWLLITFVSTLLLSAAGTATAAGKRVALVIGNARYASLPLDNPENDAKVVSATLRRLGFEVNEQLNLKVRDFRRVVREFARQTQSEEGVAVLYYAGHGVQIDGRNFLLPIDINLNNEEEVKDDSIDIEEVFISRLEGYQKQARIIILDACRDDPFRGKKTRNIRSAAGLAEMNARGALIAFASAPGAAAEDGPPGGNSVFTRHLVQEMLVEGVEVEQMFKNVRVRVAGDTKQRQTPWTNSSLMVNLSFNPGRGPGAAETARVEQERKVQESLLRFEEEKKALRGEQARLEHEKLAMREKQARIEQELKQRMAELDDARRALASARATPPTSATTNQRERDQRLLEDLDRQEKDLVRLQAELDRSRTVTPQVAAPVAAAQRPDAATALRKPDATAGRSGTTRAIAGGRCADLLMRAQLGEPLVADDRMYLQKECSR
ncbi:MAG: caspase family protein [Burkholderiales bacterium]